MDSPTRSIYIALLRGINVSGQKKILMADLRDLCASLGLANVRSYLQSGNVIFESAEADLIVLAEQLEAAIAARYGFVVSVLLRKPEDLVRVLAQNPFLAEADGESGRHYVTFLASTPDPALVQTLTVPNGETGRFAIGREELFLYVPDGYGRTKLSNAFFERKLKVAATTRNWKSVNALAEMARQ